MTIDVLTIYPEMFAPFLESGMVARAIKQGSLTLSIHNLRDWSTDKYKSVDARPFGGGAGMVMRVDIIDRAIQELKTVDSKMVLLDTKGKKYKQGHAQALSGESHIILIAPHFEGVDYRVNKYLSDEVFTVGEYVLSGGEIPTLIVIDSIARLLPGVLGNSESLAEESYGTKYSREYPHYTRPAEYNGWKVPDVLQNGNHKEIEAWRAKNGQLARL
jgi:tRNA (guanine37-N1)-methyltransferase